MAGAIRLQLKAMRVLLIYCHPNPNSFTAALRDAALRGLASGGHDVRVADLYAEAFDPVMGCDERLAYHTAEVNERPVAAELVRLRWAEALVFVYPTWWYAQPAMLKGWLDRVWIPHVTFGMPEGNRPITRTMTQIRSIAVVTSLGSPHWWWRVVGAPGQRILLRGIAALCHPRVRRRWIALHRIDTAGEMERAAFLKRVEREMRHLR
jgi:NAD(P)H dehydrogenase (quinone)